MRKVAVVTGGSRGIGRACVEAFARDGYSVVFFCHERTDLAAEVALTLRAQGFDCEWRMCDIADSNAVREAFQCILQTYHRVDVLVNNAAVSLIRLFQDTDESSWDQVMNTTLKGAYHCCQQVLPGMISRGQGSIIQIASIWGEVGASCEVAYSTAKAGLIGMTKALAKEVGPSGIRVNCVSPGVIDTDMNAALDEMTRASLADETPLGRIGLPAEVAQAVLFLAGDGASFITGQTIGVSGGFVI